MSHCLGLTAQSFVAMQELQPKIFPLRDIIPGLLSLRDPDLAFSKPVFQN
jgi:hypothetical protein